MTKIKEYVIDWNKIDKFKAVLEEANLEYEIYDMLCKIHFKYFTIFIPSTGHVWLKSQVDEYRTFPRMLDDISNDVFKMRGLFAYLMDSKVANLKTSENILDEETEEYFEVIRK